MKETMITDWILTNIHLSEQNVEVLKTITTALNQGTTSDFNVYYTNEIVFDIVGEIIQAQNIEGKIYVKILFYLDKLDIYQFDVEKIINNLPINIPLNCCV